MAKKLTDVEVRSAKPPDQGRLEITDTEAPGLALRVSRLKDGEDLDGPLQAKGRHPASK